jgi:protein-tyrosine phosphatase
MATARLLRLARALIPVALAGVLLAATGTPAAASVTLPVSGATATRAADGSYTVSWQQASYVAGATVYASSDPHATWRTAQRVVTGATGTATVTGLDPTLRWYFEVTPDRLPLGPEVADRYLHIEGVKNARDIGGYLAAGGLQVRWGVIFHSARLTTVTPPGSQELATLGLKEVVDFRNTAETTADGPDPLPAGVVHVSDIIGDPDQAEPAPPGTTPTDPITAGYLLFVSNSHIRAQLGDALRRIASPAQTPLLYHDTGGNNRVGWTTTILLTALGVPRDVVYQDYLLSTGLVNASYLDAAFAEVTAEYGSFGAYLHDGLGIDAVTLAKLRLELLQPQL